MALDTAKLVPRPAVEVFSGRKGEIKKTHLIDRVLKLQVTINYAESILSIYVLTVYTKTV